MQTRPAYAITSVDNALRLIELLQREGRCALPMRRPRSA